MGGYHQEISMNRRVTTAAVGSSDSLEAVRRYWDAHVHEWKIATHAPGTPEFFTETDAYRFEKLHYLPRLVDFEGYRNQLLLDVGCGLGNDLARFARGGALVTGIDIAPRAVELAKANFSQRRLDGRFYVMSGESLDFADEAFDVVYCHTVLHFTPDPARMVAEICRVLKPDGRAILMTVNSRSWLFLLQGIMKVEIDYPDSPVFHRFTIGEFRRLLSPFSSVRIVPERFPVATKVHAGTKARLFNALFVGTFNSLPRKLVRPLGHHLIAFCHK
jgi:2-polyprenyl-3-methyl-5-hydroxy-6-metoxy-1,4-benzoquinol methylase